MQYTSRINARIVIKRGKKKELPTPKNEVETTRAENEYRRLNGLEPRCCYSIDKPLPPNGEDCETPEKKWEEPRRPDSEKIPLEVPQRRKVPRKPPAKKQAPQGASKSHGGDFQSDMCDIRCRPASTVGDPHLSTLNGLTYDFQAVGEFTALRSKSADMVVQVRQIPWLNSRQVSVNSAIALKIHEDRVTIESGQSALVLRINGIQTKVSDRLDLDTGGSIAPTEGGYLIGWQDGSVVLP